MKRLLALVLALGLLAGCAPAAPDDGKTHILCTTYPVYLFTTAVVGDAPDVAVELLVNQQTSCLHDYTLTVEDMKAIDRADIIVMNGAGLEEFLADALAQKDVPVIDCSAGIDLLPSLEHAGHDGHDHEEEYDPHYWMDPKRAARMAENIAQGLGLAAPSSLFDLPDGFEKPLSPLITFHDGFQYFADAYGLELLASIEEEEGSEASAKELQEIIELVKGNHIPAIFVEKNGSRRSADVIARETGCKVYELDLIMSGDGVGVEPYIQAMEQNLAVIEEALR